MTEQSSTKKKSLFDDLGKATQRGIRRCPQCNTPNGTRGFICKNKLCGMVLKENNAKKAFPTPIAVRVITGTLMRLFSVQNQVGRTADHGFVQLPIVQDIEGNPTDNFDRAVLALTAKCHLETCWNRPAGSGVTGHAEPMCCLHVAAAIDCNTDAKPLDVNLIVVNSLAMPPDIAASLQTLLVENVPLVQRVGTHEMVVRCMPDAKNPFGFLHVVISDKNQLDNVYNCSCVYSKSLDGVQQGCEHFYACVSAFASDVSLAQEFSHVLNLLAISRSVQDIQVALNNEDCEDIMLPEVTTESDIQLHGDEDVNTLVFFNNEPDNQTVDDGLVFIRERARRVPMEMTALVPAAKKSSKRPSTVETVTIQPLPSETLDEGNVRLSFEEWLASVTEHINQTMHYQFDGKPEPLVFNVPHKFFDILQQRLSAGNQKKRLPNWMMGFQRKDALPLGTFTKCTWLINNIIHIKQIFDTAEVPLEITKSFLENRDGTYDVYEPPSPDMDASDTIHGRHPIRPSQLRTFLKVGKTSPDQEEPTPFIIEWIPNILPNSQVGEMRIKFEFGHQRNGHAENREAVVNIIEPPIT